LLESGEAKVITLNLKQHGVIFGTLQFKLYQVGNLRFIEGCGMFQNLFQKFLVFAVEDRPLWTVVHVQQLEQNAEDDGDNSD
jgi:hypothetical protein